MKLHSDSKQTSTKSGRSQVWHLLCRLPPLVLLLGGLSAGGVCKEKERILYLIPRGKHGRERSQAGQASKNC